MDRKKFEEKVEEYLLFDKRSLAEMLAMRDLKEEEDSEVMEQPKVESKTKKFCTGYQDFCCEETCDGCLFSQLKSTPIDENQTILVYPEVDDAIKTITARTFGFVTTSTTGRIG